MLILEMFKSRRSSKAITTCNFKIALNYLQVSTIALDALYPSIVLYAHRQIIRSTRNIYDSSLFSYFLKTFQFLTASFNLVVK